MEQSHATIYDIPLILDEIVAHLDRKDLRHCVCVSRLFWTTFVPYLWRNVHFSSLTRQERLDFAAHNAPFQLTSEFTPPYRRNYYHHSIRSIRLAAPFPIWPSVERGPCFPNLTTFSLKNQRRGVDQDHAVVIVPRLMAFIRAHWYLQDIELSYIQVESDFAQQLQGALAVLPSLAQLVLNISGKIALQDQLVLLEAGQRLEKFHLSIDSSLFEHQDLQPAELTVYQQRMAAMNGNECRIKDLYLDTELFETIMPDYMKRCPLLERLAIRTLWSGLSTVDLTDIVHDYCPRIRHLDIRSSHFSDLAQARMITACCPLSIGPHKPGLESLKIRLHNAPAEDTLQAVLSHSTTLTSFNASQGKGLSAAGLQQIVTHCVNLQSLTVRVIFSDTLSIAVDEVESQRWGCSNLRTLAILFVDHCTAPGRVTATKYLTYLYPQIGTLTTLEVLSFRMGNAGWLPLRQLFLDGLKELHNLKQLRVFGFRKEEASMLKRSQLEAMLEMWPRLEQLGGLLDHYRSLEVVRWLMKQRPDLKLSNLNDGL
ncbi:hypothetical protein BGZ99_008430 [Dissophora globulifera]|uniref:F-box domain-containing protein n=1 Tax=Dissophora globulifera TaxID=979702 RepID=A0A9P6RBB7_9FUNG|nr:hypothetical protein BGZ99_008430 [Dissophora globulifera]